MIRTPRVGSGNALLSLPKASAHEATWGLRASLGSVLTSPPSFTPAKCGLTRPPSEFQVLLLTGSEFCGRQFRPGKLELDSLFLNHPLPWAQAGVIIIFSIIVFYSTFLCLNCASATHVKELLHSRNPGPTYPASVQLNTARCRRRACLYSGITV